MTPTDAEVEDAIQTLCPHYHKAMALIDELDAWSKAGFPGASLEDVVRIAKSTEPEELAAMIRRRAERNIRKLMREEAILAEAKRIKRERKAVIA